MANLKKTHSISTIFSFFIIIFVSSSNANAVSPTGVIERSVKQQVLASLPPSHEHEPLPQSGSGTSQLFLTSTSGKYTAFLARRDTSLGSGGFGNDLCYIQVQGGGQNVWESECASISNANTCSLVFSDAGLEIYDGSRLAWDTNTDGDQVETVELLDVGDIQIRDQNGDIAWKATDHPPVNQNCGSVGGPGLLPAKPPFSTPVSGGNLPLAKPANPQTAESQTGFQQQQQQLNYPQQGLNQPFGVNNQQGLVDNNPFDSGVSIEFNIGVFILSVVISFAVSGLIA